MNNKAMQLTYDSTYVLRNISNCETRLSNIAATYGMASKEYYEAASSLAYGLATLFRFGGRITAEDDMSFVLISDTGFVLGLIFHPQHIRQWLCDGVASGHEPNWVALNNECDFCSAVDAAYKQHETRRSELLGTWSTHS